MKRASLLHPQQLKVKHDTEKVVVDYRHQQAGKRPKELDPEAQVMMLPGLLGEDPDSRGRAHRQREQLRRWLVQQQEEKAAEKHRDKMEKLQDDRKRVDMDAEALQLQDKELDRRKAAAVATKEWNLNAMTETEERRHHERHQDAAQQQGQHTGTMGAPGLYPSSDRKPPPESSARIIQFHKHQIEEKMRAELEKKNEEMRHHGVRQDSARTAVLLDRQQARRRKQLRRHVDTANKHLAASQEHRKEDIGRGHIDERFFSQFNTSCR
ncbi:RIB43A-like with coiled-coils protein 2 [Vanacampus margaritifer]